MPDFTAPERGRVALLTVNAQRDFTNPGSPLRARGSDRARSVLQPLVAGARGVGVPIVHAVRLYRPDASNVDIFRRQAVREGLRILMPGTSGAELIDEVRPSPKVRLDAAELLTGGTQTIGANEWALYKPRWGAFHDTRLEAHLRARNVSTVIVCGFNFSTSVRATIYEAGARDFRTVVVSDALSGASEDALMELGRIGVYLMPSAACLDWLSREAPTRAAA